MCNGYRARQASLLYVFVTFFGLDRKQFSIAFLSFLNLLTNRNITLIYLVTICEQKLTYCACSWSPNRDAINHT